MLKMKAAAVSVAVLLGLMLGSSCDVERDRPEVGTLVNQPVSLELGSADHANVELDMRVGELNVTGDGGKLLDGNFEYNVARWKPEVVSSQNGSHATITVRQPEGGSDFSWGNRVRNTWDLHLANKTLLDLTINCGVGQSRLNLGDVLLRNLDVKIGVGRVDLDLSGTPKRDYDVTVQGGIGQANVRLPEGVGIWAATQGGIGSIKITGLQKQGDHWQNDMYDKAKVNVKIDVKGGIGEIRLIG